MISGGLKLEIVIPDPALHITLLFLPIATFKQQKKNVSVPQLPKFAAWCIRVKALMKVT